MIVLIELLMYALAPIVAAIGAWGAAWFTAKTKFDVPESVVVLATQLAAAAARRVEAIAAAQSDRISSETKLGMALSYLDNLADDYPEAKDYVKSHAKGLVEAALRSTITPAEMTPKE
jgi:hypothetical protein